MSIHAYCGECDKQIELHKGTAFVRKNDDGYTYIMVQCPWCEEYEVVPID